MESNRIYPVGVTQEGILAKMDQFFSHMTEILALDLPPHPPCRDEKQQVAWLRANYTQCQLSDLMRRCYKVVDKLDLASPEFEVVADSIDCIWEAIDEQNRP